MHDNSSLIINFGVFPMSEESVKYIVVQSKTSVIIITI